MSTIITFYSYKGGVGRSMALANIAVLMAQRGLRVLAVDWDLEAPGLEHYFSYFNKVSNASIASGLLLYLSEVDRNPAEEENISRYRDHLWKVDVDSDHSFDLLPSGRSTHLNYARLLEEFDWQEFFARGGGDFIERLREQWRKDYDFVLVDSRTGMSDSGGVCTIQVPDVLVAIFTANHQSMSGVYDVIQASQLGRQRLAYDRGALTVLPVLSRFSANTEVLASNEWLNRVSDIFSNVCDDWLPPWVKVRDVFERLNIPQVDWFGFGERLAVVEQGTSSPGSIGYSLARITDLLVSDFADLSSAIGDVAVKPKDWHPVVKQVDKPGLASDGYRYDLFVSYSAGGVINEWVGEFVSDLEEYLKEYLPDSPGIFFPQRDLHPGENWHLHVDQAIRQSRLLLAIVNPPYFVSEFCLKEWAEFERRESRADSAPLIVPVILGDKTGGAAIDDDRLRGRQQVIVSTLSPTTKKRSKLVYHEGLTAAAETIIRLLRNVSPREEEIASGQ